MIKPTRKYSKEQEKRVAKKLNGKVQPGSGSINITSKKGDVIVAQSENFQVLVECKTKAVDKNSPGARSFSIKKEWLLEVKQQATEQGKDIPVLAFSFDGKQDYYILTSQDFGNLLQVAMEYEELIKNVND